uniref:MIP07516p n=1 Tax=Drosophila melanogaster TaxID=7227 RepID=D0IQC6_DROME|nr:MIP07516p [Drosophila melanogaster]
MSVISTRPLPIPTRSARRSHNRPQLHGASGMPTSPFPSPSKFASPSGGRLLSGERDIAAVKTPPAGIQ